MPPHFPAGRLTAGKPAPRCAQDSAIYCFIKYYRIICGRASTRPVLRYVVRDKSHLPPVFRQRALRFSVLLQNGAENGLDRRRRERSGPGATTSRRMAVRHEGGDRTAAPQGPCPLPGGAGLAGIESRDDDPPPHGHAARSAGAAFSAQNASESEYRQSRSRVIRRSRKKGFAERSRVKRSFTKAQASRPRRHAGFRPCGARAVFAATYVAAWAGAKPYVPHSGISTVLRQSQIF